MKIMKRVFPVILALSLVLALAACGGGSTGGQQSSSGGEQSAPPAQQIKLRMGTTGARGHNMTEWMYIFKEAVEAKTDRFDIEPYPASQFGTNVEMMEAVLINNLQAVGIPSSQFTSFCQFVNVLDAPYLFPDNDTAFALLNQGIDIVYQRFQEAGFYPIAWPFSAPFWIGSTVPINSVADIRGLNNRGTTSDTWIEIQETLGMNPVFMATADLPLALQQGQVDSHTSPITIIYSLCLGIDKYLIDLPGLPTFDVFMFSDDFLKGLSEADRNLLLETAKEVTRGAHYDFITAEIEHELEVATEEYGMVMTWASDADWAEIRSLLTPIKENFPANYPDLADDFFAVQAAVDAFLKK